MSNIARNIFNQLNPFTSKQPIPTVNRGMSTKYLTSMIGTAGSGKTVISTLIFLTARTLQQQLPGFHCSIDDTNSTIKADVCNMESGHFPPKTQAYNSYAYQCALNMWWGKDSLWGQKSATFQVVDLAGEDLVTQSQYQYKRPDPTSYSAAQKLVDYIYGSDIFLLAAPASRAPIFDGDTAVEQEDSDVHSNPDVVLSSIFDMIVKRRKAANRPIKGIGLCLTKCDKVDVYVEKRHHWNLYKNPEDRVSFLNKYFPWTTMSIKGLMDTWSKTNVEIFPFFVETDKDSAGNELKWECGWDTGHSKIVVEDRVPKYSQQQCVNLINFIVKQV